MFTVLYHCRKKLNRIGVRTISSRFRFKIEGTFSVGKIGGIDSAEIHR